MTPRTPLQRWLIDPVEYALLAGLFGLLRLLPPAHASNLGGWVGRTLGPRLKASDRARRNLALAMPELSRPEHERIVRDMWDNLGRIFGEMPHLRSIVAGGRVEVPDGDIATLHRLKDQGHSIIFAGAHLCNFEVFGEVAARQGFSLSLIYRRANNPLVDALFRRMRGEHLALLPKSLEGLRQVRKVMSQGGNLGILVDQKLNEGIAAPFFGRPAMTSTAPAQMALRFNAAIVVGWVERLGPARYRTGLETVDMAPFLETAAGSRRTAERALTEHLNARIEAQIRARPGDWFWLHRRWPDSKGPWPDPSIGPVA